MPDRQPKPGELDELGRLNAQLASMAGTRPVGGGRNSLAMLDWRRIRNNTRDARAREVRRLRSLPIEPWSLAELAHAFKVTRGTIQRWEDPTIDHGRRR